MTIEFNFPDNMIATCFDFDGVKVQLDKRGEDSYEINIYDPENRFCDGKLPVNYTYLNTNRIHCEEYPDIWWCCGIHDIFGSGNIINGSRYKSEHISIILQAIQNGLDELERLNKPEIIKIGNVTITKKNLPCNKVTMSVDGLIGAGDYSDYLMNGCVAYRVSSTEFVLYDGVSTGDVFINDRCYFPLKDFVLSKEDYDKVIKIITESEKKLADYNKIKIGDTVSYRYNQYNLEGRVLDIEDEFACVKTYNDIVTGYSYDKIKLAGLKKV